jgi:hypothetical protein
MPDNGWQVGAFLILRTRHDITFYKSIVFSTGIIIF